REAGLAYNHGPFGMLLRAQTFQTLQDPNAPITPPYFREPQLVLNMNETEWHGFDFAASGEYVQFRQPALLTGERAVLYPTVAWSDRGSAWFAAARTGLHATHYDDFSDPTLPGHINRVLPISSLDGGLLFERDTTLYGTDFVQTLEPR